MQSGPPRTTPIHFQIWANSGVTKGGPDRILCRWTSHYSRLIDAHMRTLRPQIGFKWHADELYFKIRGQKRYLFAVMDGSTRFILSCDISCTKFGYKARSLFRMAAEQAGCLPRILVTDGLNSFATAATKTFWRRKGVRFVHVSETHIRDQFNHNNMRMQSGPP